MRCAVILMILMCTVAAAQPVHFYVSPDGNDANDGAQETPFATVHRAQAAVRAVLAEGQSQEVVVLIHEGVYYLESPLVFTPDDAGSAPVTYTTHQDERPVLSGGRMISNWQPGENNQWTTVLPEVVSENWHFRQLFRDDVRLPRGRFPNGDGLLRVAAVNDAVTEVNLRETLPIALAAEDNAELVVYQNWSITRVRIVEAAEHTIHVSHPAGWMGHGSMTTTSPDKPCYVENALAFVDAPGEWYLDYATGILTYQAAPGEDPNEANFVAPRLETVLRIEGAPGAPVRNLTIGALTLAHTEWPLPEFGYMGIQAGHHGTSMSEPTHVLPGAVTISHAEGCSMAGCSVAHTGASGIVLGAGCRDNTIDRCTVEDVGGTGIMVGWRGDAYSRDDQLAGDYSLSADWISPTLVPTNNSVTNCIVRRCAAVNHGCVGIFDAFCDGTRIQHNHVSDLPYTGISVGFRWDTRETSQRNCRVEYNRVHDVMKVLADGGAIYTLGLQPGTVLRGNLLYDVHRSDFAHGGAPNNGIFFDEGSKGFLVEDNIIYNTSGEPIRFNQTGPENLTFNNNHFGVAPDHADFPDATAQQAGPQPSPSGGRP